MLRIVFPFLKNIQSKTKLKLYDPSTPGKGIMKIKGEVSLKEKKIQLRYTTNAASLKKSTNMFGKRILTHTPLL